MTSPNSWVRHHIPTTDPAHQRHGPRHQQPLALAAEGRVRLATVRSYLRACGLDIGLVLNFSKPTLEIRRVSADWYRR